MRAQRPSWHPIRRLRRRGARLGCAGEERSATRTTFLTVTLLAATLLASCGDRSSGPEPLPIFDGNGDVYDVPEVLPPGDPGALIRVEPFSVAATRPASHGSRLADRLARRVGIGRPGVSQDVVEDVHIKLKIVPRIGLVVITTIYLLMLFAVRGV